MPNIGRREASLIIGISLLGAAFGVKQTVVPYSEEPFPPPLNYKPHTRQSNDAAKDLVNLFATNLSGLANPTEKLGVVNYCATLTDEKLYPVFNRSQIRRLENQQIPEETEFVPSGNLVIFRLKERPLQEIFIGGVYTGFRDRDTSWYPLPTNRFLIANGVAVPRNPKSPEEYKEQPVVLSAVSPEQPIPELDAVLSQDRRNYSFLVFTDNLQPLTAYRLI